jgi:hypothetical protein
LFWAQDPVIGRDDEIRRTIQILSRRSKNNPVLIGTRPPHTTQQRIRALPWMGFVH